MTQKERLSQVKYAWAFLFKNDVNESQPFSIVPLSHFEGSNFPWHSIKGVMDSQERKKIRSLERLPGSSHRVFAKIEHGNKLFIFFLHMLVVETRLAYSRWMFFSSLKRVTLYLSIRCILSKTGKRTRPIEF